MENNKNIKLSQYSSGAGWACKISAKDLTQVLSKLNNSSDSDTFGFEQFEPDHIHTYIQT